MTDFATQIRLARTIEAYWKKKGFNPVVKLKQVQSEPFKKFEIISNIGRNGYPDNSIKI